MLFLFPTPGVDCLPLACRLWARTVPSELFLFRRMQLIMPIHLGFGDGSATRIPSGTSSGMLVAKLLRIFGLCVDLLMKTVLRLPSPSTLLPPWARSGRRHFFFGPACERMSYETTDRRTNAPSHNCLGRPWQTPFSQ